MECRALAVWLRRRISARQWVALWLVMLSGCSAFRMGTKGALFALGGQAIELRERDDAAPPAAVRPRLLLLAIDGVDRDILYDLLREGSMPKLAALLGMEAGAASHAHLEESMIATLPSSTAVAWATVITASPPAVHGIVGNEMFLRDERRFVAPVPATTSDPSDILATYTEGLVNDLLLVPTIYERMRAQDPGVRIWVAMHQIQRGADLLILPDRLSLLDAMRVILQEKLRSQISDEDASAVYEELDADVIDSVRDELDDAPAPDVLTVYLPGNDLYAHTAAAGPDAARRDYLPRVVDPLIGKLADGLRKQGALEDRWVVVTSDHGHTAVVHEDTHSLGTDDQGEPEQVLASAGFRVRPFALGTESARPDFDAVLAYQGGFAYIYLADRSKCPAPGQECDWSRKPRLHEDVLLAAEAFRDNDREGNVAAEMAGALEMILVRNREGACDDGICFQVYTGDGRVESVRAHLRKHPRGNWPRFEERLRELGTGPAAARLGDLVLIARAGDEWPLEARRYFAQPYRSYHGSAARKDSEIPLVVGHPDLDTASIRSVVERALDGSSAQSQIGLLLIELRYGTPIPSAAKPVDGGRELGRSR